MASLHASAAQQCGLLLLADTRMPTPSLSAAAAPAGGVSAPPFMRCTPAFVCAPAAGCSCARPCPCQPSAERQDTPDSFPCACPSGRLALPHTAGCWLVMDPPGVFSMGIMVPCLHHGSTWPSSCASRIHLVSTIPARHFHRCPGPAGNATGWRICPCAPTFLAPHACPAAQAPTPGSISTIWLQVGQGPSWMRGRPAQCWVCGPHTRCWPCKVDM